ncbi:HIT family protein [Micromonospora sp. NPDC049801]|uniref:HIT family protein n=1 Tax=unclassified Micromonospora TaxID=2617518 RepID=UPI0033CB667B
MNDDVGTCVFCQIGAGTATALRIYETPQTMAFVPLLPATAGHTLVIPRRHVTDLWALASEDVQPLMDTVLDVSHAIREALASDGLNLIISAGQAASQTIPHLHIHLVPRWHDDPIQAIWPARAPTIDSARLERTAERIQAAMPPCSRASRPAAGGRHVGQV